MPFTELDAQPALVLIDLQKGIARMPTAEPAMEVVGRAATLAAAFREHKLPVVLVRVTGRAPGRTDLRRPTAPFPPDFSELLPQLHQQPSDIVIDKQRFGAFIGTALDSTLRARGVTQVVLGGISTSSGVESTARSAYDLGYHVAFVTDAMTDTQEASHRHSIENIFPKLGESGLVADMLQLLRDRR